MILYDIIIQPIEYLIEVVFTVMSRFFPNEGYAIIAVSIIISTLILPLYLRGDIIQSKEQDKQKSMEKWLNHIRKNFRGDERYMILNAYYREQEYRPIHTLRGVIPILLQIPFFIAGYHFLSGLQCIHGVSFGLIRDLGAEDGMLWFGAFRCNLLPILMTLINIISATIYTKDSPLKTRIQPYILALLFLFLLYRSPSGLVLYWTMNNLYSLAKNIIMRYVKTPRRLMDHLLVATAILYIVYLIMCGKIKERLLWKDREALFLYGIIILILCLPEISSIIGNRKRKKRGTETVSWSVIVALEMAFTVLWGTVIPLLVISVAPDDFLALDKTTSPFQYVIYATSVSAGIFLLWGSILCYMMEKEKRSVYVEVLFTLLFISIINVMLFCASVGNISTMLEFDLQPHHDLKTKGINLIVIIIGAILSHMIWQSGRSPIIKKLRKGIIYVILLSLVGMSVKDAAVTAAKIGEIKLDSGTSDYVIPMTRTGKNVVIIMLDRAIGGMVPYIFDEKPELKEIYEGFVYYPQTLSYGVDTRGGAPGLYGGYDYSTANINLRLANEGKSLPDQHDEALLTMPILFSRAGWEVTVIDPPIVHWSEVRDLDMFRQYPGIEAFDLSDILPTGYSLEDYVAARKRNFLFYSIYRSMPAMLQDEVYDTGGYLAADRDYFLGDGSFRIGYTELRNMGRLMQITDDPTDHFIDLVNGTTHGPAMLSLPDYRSDEIPDYTGIDVAADKTVDGRTMHFDRENEDFNVGHYHSNMAAYLYLGEWIEQLKEWGVYDNTRIILVSDHGCWLEHFDYMTMSKGIDVEAFNALLMVKDFNSRDEFRTDNSFMSNADTPVIAMEGLVEDPHSPFTGHPITMEGKSNGLDIYWPGGEMYNAQPRYHSAVASKWFHVDGDIFNEDSWILLERDETLGRP